MKSLGKTGTWKFGAFIPKNVEWFGRFHQITACQTLNITSGNCNIPADQTILVMNEMKKYEICPRSKSWYKIIRTLQHCFIKSVN